LVTDSRGDTTEKGRHFGTGLSETEDVVDEEQHILAFLVTEVLGNGEAGEGDTSTGTGGLVHLTEDESDLGVTLKLDDTGLNHLVVEIVTLTGTLTDTAEDGETTMGLGDVVDEFLNQHSLSDTGTSEETNLSTTGVRREKVDDLDTGLQNLGGGGLVDEGGRLGVNRRKTVAFDGTTLVNGLANDVHDATESSLSDGNHDRVASVDDLGAANETLSTVHGNGADCVLAQMGRDLENETTTGEVLDLEGVEDGGKVVGFELHVDDGTNDGLDDTDVGGLSSIGAD